MECSEPGIIRDEELLAYLSGEKVRPIVPQHIARCQRCASQLAAYRQMEGKFTHKLYRFDCPPAHILGEYQLGLLEDAIAADVRDHLNHCELCAAEIASLTVFLAQPALPAELSPVLGRTAASNNHHPVQEVKQAWQQVREQTQASIRNVVAALLPQQPRLAYLRDANQQVAQWPRRYVAEDIQVSLQLEPGSGRDSAWQLIGLVRRDGLSLDALAGIPVRLSSSVQVVYTQQVDELGNFVFAALAPDTYTLELQCSDKTILIDQLAVLTQEG